MVTDAGEIWTQSSELCGGGIDVKKNSRRAPESHGFGAMDAGAGEGDGAGRELGKGRRRST
jgi:hypothetical protein